MALTTKWTGSIAAGLVAAFSLGRFPQPKYASYAIANLLTYMIGNANGQVYKGPGIKR